MSETEFFAWEAVYYDGTSLWEYNSSGEQINTYGDIERDKLAQLNLYITSHLKKNDIDAKPIITLPLGSFKITEQCLTNLKAENISDDILRKLQTLLNHEITEMEYFLEVLKRILGVEQTLKLKSVILKYAFLKSDSRLILRRIRRTRMAETHPFMTIYLIGWQKTVPLPEEAGGGDRNIQSLLYIYPDGTLTLGGGEPFAQLYDFENI